MYFKNRTDQSPDELNESCRIKREKKMLSHVSGAQKLKDKRKENECLVLRTPLIKTGKKNVGIQKAISN